MTNFKKLLLVSIFIVFLTETLLWAGYIPGGRLLISNLNFCVAKPRGLGRFEQVNEKGFKIGEDAYLYMEAENCKSIKRDKFHRLYLIIDMDIYYEEGTCVYSQKEVKSFNPESERKFSKTFMWVKIETRYLKPGEYKVEVKVRDENSGKEGFALKNLKIY